MRQFKTEEDIILHWQYPLENIFVSICCFTYNHENFIRDALSGFLMQETQFPFEIIIHDDASIDSTGETIREYMTKYPRLIRCITQDQNTYSLGEKQTRVVFPRCKGKYIALCDGDDFWTDNKKIEKQVSFLESDDSYSICYHNYQPFDSTGHLVKSLGGATRDLTSQELKRAHPIYSLTACFRNVPELSSPESIMADFGDLFFWSILGNYGKGKFIGEIKPSMYRVHEGGVFSKQDIIRRREMRLRTDSALYAFYARNRDIDLKLYYIRRVAKNSLRILLHFYISKLKLRGLP